MPKISVLMAAYNLSEFIQASLESLQNQTLEDFECIVIDDGSTDDTAQKVEGLKDPRFRLIRLQHSGYAAALNTGIRASSATILAILDGDDLLHRSALERHLAAHHMHPHAALIFHRSHPIDQEGRSTGRPQPSESLKAIHFPYFVYCSPIWTNSALSFKRQALKTLESRIPAQRGSPFDESLQIAIDKDFYTRLVAATEVDPVAIDEVLTEYRIRRGCLTEAAYDRLHADEHIITRLNAARPELALNATTMRAFWYWRMARMAPLHHRRRPSPLLLVYKALRLSPAVALQNHRTALKATVEATCYTFLPDAAYHRLLRFALRVTGSSTVDAAPPSVHAPPAAHR